MRKWNNIDMCIRRPRIENQFWARLVYMFTWYLKKTLPNLCVVYVSKLEIALEILITKQYLCVVCVGKIDTVPKFSSVLELICAWCAWPI